MTSQPTPPTDDEIPTPDKQASISAHLIEFATELETIAANARRLAATPPTPDMTWSLTKSQQERQLRDETVHWSCAAAKTARHAIDTATMHRDGLLSAATREPYPVPLARLATAAGMNLKTLRVRIGRDMRRKTLDETAPY